MSESSTGGHARTPGRADRILNGWQRMERLLSRWFRRNTTALLIAAFFLVASIIMLAPNIFINVPAGHVGVMWYRFFGGTVTERTYGEGMRMIFPWDEMYIYDARLQNTARVFDTISSNGLAMQVEIAVRYRINRDTGGLLHKLVGPNYPDILVYPEIGSHARELISRYTPEQLYTETRGFIQAEILERMINQLGSSLANQSFGGRLVTVEDVLLRSVILPAPVAQAIERKAAQFQLMLEYDFRLAREEKERQRKRIEAEGVRDFQDIVAQTITEEYLRLRGIEATLALSTSPNSKTVIIGGRDGLPIILNAEGGGAPRTSPGGSAVDTDVNPPNARREDPLPPVGSAVAPSHTIGDSSTPPPPVSTTPPSPGTAVAPPQGQASTRAPDARTLPLPSPRDSGLARQDGGAAPPDSGHAPRDTGQTPSATLPSGAIPGPTR